jgi:hypothetical protein
MTTAAADDWKVLPHGPIEKLSENLWWVWGSVPGMSLKRTMTIARLRDGRLVIHNAIALEEATMAEIEAWGTPAFVIVPNGYHRLDAPKFKKRYPAVKIVAPKGSRTKIEEVIPVELTYDEVVADDTIGFRKLAGVRDREGAMLVRSSDGTTVVLNDAVFNMDRKRDVMGFVVTTILGSAPGPRVSRLAKLALVEDKKALRADLESLAAMPELARLIVAHEKVTTGREEAAAVLRRAAEFL